MTEIEIHMRIHLVYSIGHKQQSHSNILYTTTTIMITENSFNFFYLCSSILKTFITHFKYFGFDF